MSGPIETDTVQVIFPTRVFYATNKEPTLLEIFGRCRIEKLRSPPKTVISKLYYFTFSANAPGLAKSGVGFKEVEIWGGDEDPRWISIEDPYRVFLLPSENPTGLALRKKGVEVPRKALVDMRL